MSEPTTTTTRWDELSEAGRQAVARGDLVAATSAHRSALEEAESTAPESARVASSLASLGQVRYQARDYAEAEQLFRRALQLRERLLGAEHPNVAQTLNNLAAVHVALGALDAAEPLLLRALAITERHRGTSHPDVAVNLNNLAKLYFKRNEHARAEPLLTRLLELEKASGPAHPKVGGALTSLASVRLALGDLTSAEALLREAEAIVGPQHASLTAVRARIEAVRSGRATPNGSSRAIDPATISGPIALPLNPTPTSVAASSDAPPRRNSRPLPPNPWLAESEPPSVIAAESGDYAVTGQSQPESTVIVPSTTQEPIAPQMAMDAPAPLPPIVVPPQVPREFGDAWGREASEGASVTAKSRASIEMRAPVEDVPTGLVAGAAPIKEAPSARPTSAHIEAAAAAISRFAPPPPVIPAAPPTPPKVTTVPSVPAAAAPVTTVPSVPAAAAPVTAAPPASAAPAQLTPPPLILPPVDAPKLVVQQLVPPPLIPPPVPSGHGGAAPAPTPAPTPAAPPAPSAVATAIPSAPPVAYAPPPAATAFTLERDMAPMPPLLQPSAIVPPPAPRPVKPPSSEGPRFPEEARHRPAPRKPRLHPDGSASSGGFGKLVAAALVLAALGGGGWYMFGRGEGPPLATTAASAEAGVIPQSKPTTPVTAAPAPSDPTTASGAPDESAASFAPPPPADNEITSSPVPLARREAPRREEPKPAPAPIAIPTLRTDAVTRGIDSVTKAKVDASLRPKVAQPQFAKPASP